MMYYGMHKRGLAPILERTCRFVAGKSIKYRLVVYILRPSAFQPLVRNYYVTSDLTLSFPQVATASDPRT